ncbi:MAG TPA: formate dehydrogenase accessory sulfurtransferase FdhD [Bacteroidia bacterium]|jgi:FdhD protein|nr:formate dehydrogenase accessory sulfurtransferase FdhD [Bacteroidia bacterium]
MLRPSVAAVQVRKISPAPSVFADDLLAAEEPMEIRLGFGPRELRAQKSIAVTMRTPGMDFELALGFLFTEGIITHYSDVLQIKYCSEAGTLENRGNIVQVELKEEIEPELSKMERNFYTSSSCGVCGKASIESIRTTGSVLHSLSALKVSKAIILSLPDKLREKQAVFQHTGGLHACALFDNMGNLLFLCEDVGRHNALDKLIGTALISGSGQLSQSILLLSGRASFELIQKAAMAGIPLVCAVGAPSSLAVETAKAFGITLLGFLRENRFNIYTDDQQMLIQIQ